MRDEKRHKPIKPIENLGRHKREVTNQIVLQRVSSGHNNVSRPKGKNPDLLQGKYMLGNRNK